jgi:tripartite-type tricarboxylate transporter receptor subunit TctC
MQLHRRKFLRLSAAQLALPAVFTRGASADAWPTREVKIVVGFEPGGATDIIARTLAERLKEVWNQPVAVENKPGHGGNVAAEMVAKSKADGYTVFIVGPGQALNQFMYPKLAYDPVKDFEPVTLLVSQANVMAVSSNSRFRSVKDFIDYCKAEPGKATYASSGVGTSLHLCGELFEHLAHVQMKHMPFKGSEPALREVLLERVDVIFDNVTSVLPHVMAGNARALAVTTAKRMQVAPNVPTLIESGIAGFDVASWFALFVPDKTPRSIVAKIHDDAVAALNADKVKPRLLGLGCEIIGSTPDQLATHMKSEMDRWGPAIRKAGIRVEN